MISATVSNALTCIIPARDDASYTSKDDCPILKQCQKYNPFCTVNAVCNSAPERHGEQLYPENAVKISGKIWKIDWREELTLPPKYFTYCNRPIHIFTQAEGKCDTPLGTIKAVQHQIELKRKDNWPIYSASHLPGPKAGELETLEINGMLDMDIIEPIQTDRASPIVFLPKEDVTLSFCVDYRKLKAVKMLYSYLILHMDYSIDSLGDATIFSTWDTNSRYWQVWISEEHVN